MSEHLLLKGEKRFLYLIVFLFFVLPSGNQIVTNLALFALFVHSFISFNKEEAKAALVNPITILPALFFLYYASTAFWSQDLSTVGSALETKLSILLSPFFLVLNKRFLKVKYWNSFLKAIVFGTLTVFILALLRALYRSYLAGKSFYLIETPTMPIEVSFFTYQELIDVFMHPGYFATFLGISAFICIHFMVLSKAKVLWTSVLLFLLAGMVLVQGRINLLAFIAVVGMGIMIYTIRSKNYKWLFIPFFGIIAGVLFLLFAPSSLKDRYLSMPDFSYSISGGAEEFSSATYRLANWSSNWKLAQEDIWFGKGIGDRYQAILNNYQKLGFHQGYIRGFNAHNQFLEVLIAGGVFGLLFYSAWLWGYFLISSQLEDYLIMACLVFFVFCTLTESMMERAWAIILFTHFFPMGLLIAQKRKKQLMESDISSA